MRHAPDDIHSCLTLRSRELDSINEDTVPFNNAAHILKYCF